LVFIDTTGVHPKVLQAVTPRLFSAELYLSIASLVLIRAAQQTLSAAET